MLEIKYMKGLWYIVLPESAQIFNPKRKYLEDLDVDGSLEYKTWEPNTNKTGSTILKEWTAPDSRNTSSATNLVEEEIVDAQGNDGNVTMPELVKRPNSWRKVVMMMNAPGEKLTSRKHVVVRNYIS